MTLQDTDKFEEHIQQDILQKITTVRNGFRKGTHRRIAFEQVLRDHYERLHNNENATQEYIATSLAALHRVLDQPELVEPQLLVSYITEIIRFVGDVGLGLEFAEKFVDRIMHVYQQAGYSLTELYLVKARYLPIHGIEHIEREKVFLEARRHAENTGSPKDQVLILLELAEYYTVVSQYEKSVAACHACEQLIRLDSSLQQYSPLVLIDLGMNHFPLYDFDRAKHYFLQAEALLQNEQANDRERGDQYFRYRVLSNALHYLGRDAHMRGDFAMAMQYYVEALQYQQRSLGDAGAVAFHHLRIGELLLQASLVNQARDHLRVCQETIHATIVAGTALIQLQLAWAKLYDTEGSYTRARECVRGALEEARKNNTSRMELGCLLRLFQLELRYRHVLCALNVALQVTKTWQHGELRKGGVFRFFRVFGSFKQLQISFHILFGRPSREALPVTCTCPMHLPTEHTLVPQPGTCENPVSF